MDQIRFLHGNVVYFFVKMANQNYKVELAKLQSQFQRITLSKLQVETY